MIELYRVLKSAEKDSYPLFETEMAISTLESPYGQELFRCLLLRPEFGQTAEKLRNFLGGNPTFEGLRVKKKRIAGFLFENLGVEFVKDGVEGEIVLPPSAVFAMFQSIHSARQIMAHGLGSMSMNVGLEGVRVPDALLITKIEKEAKITAVCECSISNPIRPRWRVKRSRPAPLELEEVTSSLPFPKPTIIRTEFFRGLVRRYLEENHRGFSSKVSFNGNLRVLYIAPKGNRLAGRLANEKVWHVPFTREEFYRVLDGFFADVRNGLSP